MDTKSRLNLQFKQKIDVPLGVEYVVDCRGKDAELDDEIVEFVNRSQKEDNVVDNEGIRTLAEHAMVFDSEVYEEYRREYGTKAANLFVFAGAMDTFRKTAGEEYHVADVTVPEFTAASVKLHEFYKAGDPEYEVLLEEVRQRAVTVTDDVYDPELFRPLVAIRSSAVLSEDGENASGAGIYSSVAVDPRDPIAFKRGVETVFESLSSEEAKAYLANLGIENERMGLLIQQYIDGIRRNHRDECAYGYAQSSDPFKRFITLSSETGELLFDRKAVEEQFMVAPPGGNKQPTFHYIPEHDSKIRGFSYQGAQVANAALFAEKLFGKHVELEFAFDSSRTAYVVQVRPLPRQEKPPQVEFPSDAEPILVCRAIGVGDITVAVRDDQNYDNDEYRFDVVDNEDMTGRSASLRHKKAVFVIGYNDGHSGHIQMLARERGQICLYPEAQTGVGSDVQNNLAPRHSGNRVRRFRVVSDGYRGAIYPIDEERAKLLKDLATSIARYATTKATVD